MGFKEVYNADTPEGPMEVHGQMWHSDDFEEYMKRTTGKADVWATQMQPAMKQIVQWSLQSVQDSVENRKNSCELLGYDFMFDDQLQPWLIEVNSSPACDYSTPIAERQVKNGLRDAVKVVVDYQKWEEKMIKYNRKMDDPKYSPPETGRFDCIFKGPPLPAPITSLGAEFEVKGKKLKRRGMLHGPGAKTYGMKGQLPSGVLPRVAGMDEQRKQQQAKAKAQRERQQQEQQEQRKRQQERQAAEAAAMYGFGETEDQVSSGSVPLVPRCFQVAQVQQKQKQLELQQQQEKRAAEIERMAQERVAATPIYSGIVPRVASMSRHTGFNAFGGETHEERERRLQVRRQDRAQAAIRKQEILGGLLADRATGRAVGAAVPMKVSTINFGF